MKRFRNSDFGIRIWQGVCPDSRQRNPNSEIRIPKSFLMIHATAIVSPEANIGADVAIGPYCRIGDRVRIGDGCRFDSHVIVEGPTTIGEKNHFFPVRNDRTAASGSQIRR